MPQSKSSEIRLVFLEEASAHLNTIQSSIYQLAAESRLEQQELNDVILAAHSIKGGARMTGFHCLAQILHLTKRIRINRKQENKSNI